MLLSRVSHSVQNEPQLVFLSLNLMSDVTCEDFDLILWTSIAHPQQGKRHPHSITTLPPSTFPSAGFPVVSNNLRETGL